MALTNATLQTMLTALKGAGSFVSLHTADPGTTGANEVTGGSYARVQATLPTGANGTATAPIVSINVPAGVTVTHVGVWSAVTAGTFVGGSAALSPSLAFPVPGRADITLTETVLSG